MARVVHCIRGMNRTRETNVKKKTTRKRAARAPAETVLVLRTCEADMTSNGGRFTWPASGKVSAPDWNPEPVCGYGLHGFAWGVGDSSLASWSESAKWLVVEVVASDIVELDGKVKFPRGRVVYCGTRLEATAMIAARKPGAIMGHTANTGDGGTSTSGDGGTSTSGDCGTSTSGYGGTSTSGYGGTSTSGDGGTLVIKYHDGERYRLAVAYVGENGIKADTKYRLDAAHKFVEAP